MLEEWVSEVFVHEFGHHVHWNYLADAGKAAWNAGWEEVEEAQQQYADQVSVTHADRLRFFDLIKRSAWSPQKAGRKVKGVDRLKYLAWLYSPQHNRIISTPTQVRLTDYGRHIFEVLADPEGWVEREFDLSRKSPEGRQEAIARWVAKKTRQAMNTLGVLPDYAGRNYPQLSPEIVEKARSEDKTIDAALDALGIPTEYGRTNVGEDFAETFVLFMTDPNRLSDMARYRMSRALWLSGFHGKPVMRIAVDMSYRLARRWIAVRRPCSVQ